jgi:hypothetical protein
MREAKNMGTVTTFEKNLPQKAPLTPPGLCYLMALAFSPRCFATKKNMLTSCLERDQCLMLSQ